MKDFDRAELGAVRTMAEADYFLKKHKDAAVRQEFAEKFVDRVKAAINRAVFKEGKL